jgi:hypothetical protein
MNEKQQLEAILSGTHNFPISLNMACRLLHKSKGKVRQMIGTKVGIVKDVEKRAYTLNLADVLKQIK